MSVDQATPRPRLLIPFLVLGVSLILSLVSAAYVAHVADAKDRARFSDLTERNQLAIQRRLETYVNVLRGAAGLYAAQGNRVSVAQFRTYVDRLELRQRYPGIVGIGASTYMVDKDLSGAALVLAAQGISNFHLYPPGPRPRYLPIVFLEPLDPTNRKAIGYDSATDPALVAAMNEARDTGNAAATGKVTLIQDTDHPQPAFIVYVPAYYTITVPTDLADRRTAIGGFLFAPFRVNDLLQGIFGGEHSPSGISFAVYDGDAVSPDALLYGSAAGAKPRFTQTAALDVPGRRWTVVYTSGPQFEVNAARGFELLVLGAGGMVSVVLFVLTWGQASARRRAEHAAHELRLGEQRLLAAHADVERALDQAEEANELKDQFLATVSHELRTPLHAIHGWTHLLKRIGTSDPEELRHGLETIQRATHAQGKLIEDLLDVSRIVTGKLRLEVHTVALKPVIEAAIGSVHLAGEARGVRIESFLDAAIAVTGDPTRLQQILWNLLSNAVKFTPANGSVRIDLSRDGSHARVAVTDSGVGISAEFLPHVFERFRQADGSSTRQHGGLGLGLAIARHLTELHGGTIRADSPGPGRGATFTVELPLATTASSEGATQPPPSADGPSLEGVRVLLVEDDPTASDIATRMLRARGAQVTASRSSAEALSDLASAHPDVIVSDIGMPGEDGYTFIGKLRALSPESGGRLPAIAVTALARPDDRERALHAGFQRHVPKPVDPDELVAAITELLIDADGENASAAASKAGPAAATRRTSRKNRATSE